jgi:hypothetical protein
MDFVCDNHREVFDKLARIENTRCVCVPPTLHTWRAESGRVADRVARGPASPGSADYAGQSDVYVNVKVATNGDD